MDWIYVLILVSAGLVIASILTSILAFRVGAPLLLVFLVVGVVAGEDGLGLQFDNAEVAYFVGSVALAVILFDSGFGTRAQTFRRAAGPAIVLATLGVLLTALLVGAAAHFLFGLPWPHALLIGAIISSTDAAAVFFLLRAGGISIYKRVRSILEVESGSNDPMAIFLTIFFIELILHGSYTGNPIAAFATGFGQQMGLGLLAGVVSGYLIVEMINRVELDEGLYPIAVMAAALSVFALTGYLGGSGFLAVYAAGIIAGNRKMRAAATLRRYQKGMTWVAQMAMFLVLGLFVTPSEFADVALPAIALALFLMFVARPCAVWLCLLPFRPDRKTVLFISWVGLRGAVSILLGILPIVSGVEGGNLFLNVAFIMVLVSLLVQGWTIRPAARHCDLIVPRQIEPVERIEIELPGNPKHELLIYQVMQDSPLLTGDELPRWARPSLVVRDGATIDYARARPLQPGDYVYLFAPPKYVGLLDRLFARPRSPDRDDSEFFGEFSLRPDTSLRDLASAYDVQLPADVTADQSVGEYAQHELGMRPVPGDRVSLGPLDIVVRSVYQGSVVTEAGLTFRRSAAKAVYHRRRSGRAAGALEWLRRVFSLG